MVMPALQLPVETEPREFAFTSRDFQRVRDLIYARAGIALNPRKQNMVYGRLSRRLRACGYTSFNAYLDMLEHSPGSQEWEAFTNALTTNLTAFFREAHHFPVLKEHLLARRNQGEAVIWCSAASTGEEPYTIAITACEAFGSLNPPVRIIASDIDTNVLATADAGVYALDRVAGLPGERVRRFFLRGSGANAGYVRVRPELRKLVHFQRVNLLDERWQVAGGLAAIFCRNVLIYFDRPTQLRIVSRFAPLLADDGVLFAGHSESLAYASEHFRLRRNTVYEKARSGGKA